MDTLDIFGSWRCHHQLGSRTAFSRVRRAGGGPRAQGFSKGLGLGTGLQASGPGGRKAGTGDMGQRRSRSGGEQHRASALKPLCRGDLFTLFKITEDPKVVGEYLSIFTSFEMKTETF